MPEAKALSTTVLIQHAQTLGQPLEALFIDCFNSVSALLAERARDAGEKVFLCYFDDETGERSTFTWRQFDRAVQAAACLLTRYGIGRGDCIATLSCNHPVAAILLFAAWQLGAIAAPQNPGEDDSRIGFILKDAQAKLLFAHSNYLERARGIAAGSAHTIPVLGFEELQAESPQVIEASEPVHDLRYADALLVYTSGTTGNPKGVMLTQYNLLINAFGTAQWLRADTHTCFMCVLPIHHVNGIVVTLMTPLVAGARVVLNRFFKASLFWARIAAERVHIVSTVPTILQFLCEVNEDIRGLDLSAFRFPICGAGTLPVALAKRFEQCFGLRILHGYGLSETTAYACMLPVDLGEKAHRRWLCETDYPSIGTPLPYCEMAIHDATGKALAAGQRGEIVIRGPYVMAGYFQRPEANAETFKHGWFRSGDEGFYESDEQGQAFFFITGRLKEIINRGGVKYSPFEIEEVLLQIPGVRVGLTVAFDNKWYGEEIGAYVVRDAKMAVTEQEILAYCRKRMPFPKCPKVIVFGEEIPLTATGKYQRLKLKPLFAKYLNTQFSG